MAATPLVISTAQAAEAVSRKAAGGANSSELPNDYYFDFFELDFDLLALFGFPLRFVLAIFFNWPSLIELAMLFDAPRSPPFGFLPRFAASAAPAAICCFLDFAGIQIHRLSVHGWL